MPGSFFDSNVVLYAASGDRTKRERSRSLLVVGGTISVQVLNEITNVCRRKLHLTWDEVRAFSNLVRESTTVVPVTVKMHERGIRIAERYGLSVYDAFVAAAAVESGCDTLLSEDMHAGLSIDGTLRIVNPFAE
jgi:predicted nucleic acid-binding protein